MWPSHYLEKHEKGIAHIEDVHLGFFFFGFVLFF